MGALKMPKVSVDKDLCIGCGLCADTCAEVFHLEDDGKAGVQGRRFDLPDRGH